MEQPSKILRILVFITALVAASLIAVGAVYEVSMPAAKAHDLVLDGRPRIGRLEAKIELVLVEDLRCGACQYFTQKVFPEIQRRYIDTGLAYCIIVPVSFLEGSQPISNAALAVYQLAPERFLPFVHALCDFYHDREVGYDVQDELIQIAEQVGGIDLPKLKEYIAANSFARQLDQNFDWAKRIMGHKFGTPALFVNGVRTSIASAEAISAQIEKLEKSK
jgi:protein-disulfide isomerase